MSCEEKNAYMNTLKREDVGNFACHELPTYDANRLKDLTIKYLRGKVAELEAELEYLKTEKDAPRILVSAMAYLGAMALRGEMAGSDWGTFVDSCAILARASEELRERVPYSPYTAVGEKYRHLWEPPNL